MSVHLYDDGYRANYIYICVKHIKRNFILAIIEKKPSTPAKIRET